MGAINHSNHSKNRGTRGGSDDSENRVVKGLCNTSTFVREAEKGLQDTDWNSQRR